MADTKPDPAASDAGKTLTFEQAQKLFTDAEATDPTLLDPYERHTAYKSRIQGYADTARGADASAYRESADIRAKTPQQTTAINRYGELLAVVRQKEPEKFSDTAQRSALVFVAEYLEDGYDTPTALAMLSAGYTPAMLDAAANGDLKNAVTQAKRKATMAAKTG